MALTKVKLIADGVIVQSNLNASHGITTADIGENASYLYYTDARARAAISVSGNALSYNSSTGVITSNFEESPTFTGNVVIDGTLGVGTSPDGNLEVIADTIVSGASDTVNNVLIGLQSTNRPTIILDTADTTYTNRTWNITNVGSVGSLFFGRNGLDVLVMKNDGSVGIGTTGPQRRLHINSTNESTGIFLERTSNYGFVQYNQVVGSVETYHLGFVNNNTFSSDILVANESGNVGIGITSPAAKLHVSGDTGGVDSIARFQNTNSAKITRLQLSDNAGSVGDALIAYDHSNANSALHYLGMGVNNNTTLVINNNDYVGIGTTSPGYKLDVTNVGADAINVNASTDFTGIRWSSDQHTYSWRVGGDVFFIYDVVNSAQRVTLDASGNLGIGTTSPAEKLEVEASSAIIKVQSTTAGANANIHFETTAQKWGVGPNMALGSSDFEIYSYTAGQNRLVIDSYGRVGIGTTSPESGAKLDVRAGAGGKVVFGSYDANYKVVIEAGDQLNFYNGTSATTAYINYSQSGTPGNVLLSRNLLVEANSSGGTSGTVRIKSDGKVGIGTTSPSQKLDVSGIVKQNGANNYENILVKSGSTGTFTFTQSELNSQMVDNVSYFIFVSVYRPTTDVTNDVGTLLLHGIMPRGSNSTFNTINTLKGSGISVLTATNSGNSLVITTDSGTTFRCAIKIIAIGGTS